MHLDQRAVHDLEFEGTFAGGADVDVGDGVQLGQRVAQLRRFGGPAGQRRLADLLQHLQKQGLFVLEMAVQHRFRHPGGLGDFFGRRRLVAERDEQLFGVGQELALPLGFTHTLGRFAGLGAPTLGKAHGHPQGTSCESETGLRLLYGAAPCKPRATNGERHKPGVSTEFSSIPNGAVNRRSRRSFAIARNAKSIARFAENIIPLGSMIKRSARSAPSVLETGLPLARF